MNEEMVNSVEEVLEVPVQELVSNPEEIRTDFQKTEDPLKGAEFYKYADLVIECESCGTITKLEHPAFKNVEIGLQLPFLYSIKNEINGVPKFLSVSCSNCKNKLTIKFIESENTPVEIIEPVAE